MTVAETSSGVPVASAIWAAEQVAAELRETYLGVAAATVLLERVGAGSTHPAIRLARRNGEDALDLAGDVERQVSDGVQRLRVTAGHRDTATIGGLIEVLDSVRDQLGGAADRVSRLPARVTTAGQQLLDADRNDDPAIETTVRQWQCAAEQLDLMTKSLMSAVAALASYTGGLSGPEPATT